MSKRTKLIDNQVATCNVNDGKTEITMSVYRDSGSTPGDVVPEEFGKACAVLREGSRWTDRSVNLP